MPRRFQIDGFESIAREVEAGLDSEDHVGGERGAAVVWGRRGGGELVALKFVVAGSGSAKEALGEHYVVAFEAEVVA